MIDINGAAVEIVVGDLFEEEGIKVIPFTEHFDTEVDDRTVSERSLNGSYIKRHLDVDPEELACEIEADSDLQKQVIPSDGGGSHTYRLGSIHIRNDFALVAFSHIDSEKRAKLTLAEYTECLLHFWSEIDRTYAMKNVSLPLLGGGITRISGNRDVDHQLLLSTILGSLALSNFVPCHGSRIRVVLTQDAWKKVNPFAYQNSRVMWRVE